MLAAGWSFGLLDPYDESYYRRWTHELPPLQHNLRGTVVDVHHAILQERSPAPASRARMSSEAVLLDDGFAVLRPEDMLLHAAAHLFCDGEFDKGLRDLVDITQLARHFTNEDAGFWDALLERARIMQLDVPLAYALRASSDLLGLEIPGSVERALARSSAPAWLRSAFEHGLRPHHPSCADLLTGPSLGLLYLRAHYLRMPLPNLVAHLARKAVTREKAEDTPLPVDPRLLPERG